MKDLLRLKHASVSGAGAVIATPGAGKMIVIVDVLASAATTLKQTDGSGSVIAYIPAGSVNLRSGIGVGANVAVHSTAGNVTITYFVQDVTP
jgi:hypothetical protein